MTLVKRRFCSSSSCRPSRTAWLAMACAGALLAGCGEKKADAPPPQGPMPVTVLEMQPQKAPIRVEVMGQAEGAREAEVRARVGGILLKRLYQEGEPVKAGQALFQIDRAPYEIAAAEARARAEQTAREVARLKGLAEAKAVAQKDYDDAVVSQYHGPGGAQAGRAEFVVDHGHRAGGRGGRAGGEIRR